MKQKLLINRDGVILNVLPVDHKWGRRDLDGGRYEKLVDEEEFVISDMRKRRIAVDKDGELYMKPEDKWPETIQAKQEQLAEVTDKLKAQIDEGKFIENPDGSYNIQKLLATVEEVPVKKVL